MPRPKADIKGTEVKKLASYGLNNTEIADFFNVSESTIRSRFNEFLTKGRSELKKKLRKAQIDTAMKGNATLLIWLGKQYLGQKDSTETTIDNEQLKLLFKVASKTMESNV